MKNKIMLICIVMVGIFLVSCTSPETPPEPVEPVAPEETGKVCTREYEPVCGIDDETYANKCTAGDVEIAYEGKCIETHECTEEEKENQICTLDYTPVCGNDEKTYANGCSGCSAGIDSWIDGECPVDDEHICSEEDKSNENCPFDYRPVCSGDETYTNGCVACAAGVEKWTNGECAGPTMHTCTEEESQAQVCTYDYTPVCGVDGQTYSNGCSACSAGVESWELGEC